MKILPAIISVAISLVIVVTILGPAAEDYGQNRDVVDVVLIIGQSNAAYRESLNYRVSPAVATNELDTHPGLTYYGTETSPATYEVIGAPTYDTTFESYSIRPMCADGEYVIGGLEAPIASTINKRTGHDVAVINVAVAGAPIDWLNPDGSWGAFASGVIDHALDDLGRKYSKIDILGWVCLQGEANASTAIDTYKEKFMRMADWIESKGFHEGYLVPPRTAVGGNSIQAQQELAGEHSNLHIVAADLPDTFTTANGLLYTDGIHYTERGRILIGKDVAESMAEINDPPLKAAVSIIPIIVVAGIIVSFMAVVLKPE